MSFLRAGPRGFPRQPTDYPGSIRFNGGSGTRFCTGITTAHTEFAMVAHIKPETNQSVGGAAIWSKIKYFAAVQGDFPTSLGLNTSRVPIFTLDSGNDFSVDSTVTADIAMLADRWGFVGASYSKIQQLQVLVSDGNIKVATGINITPSAGKQYVFGNVAEDFSGGTDGQRYWGWAWWPRLYNVFKSPAQLLAIQRGFDDRVGLIAEFQSADLPAAAFFTRKGR